jgi:hypothetical protein
VRGYLLSLPERVLRSASALAAGLVNEIGEAALPAPLRRTRLYRNLVEVTLRFFIEELGEVEGIFPAEGQLTSDFLLRRTAGNGIELIGLLTFRASPVWVFAALADLTGAGHTLITEIAASLRQEGLIAPDSQPSNMDQILDALEETSAQAAASLNTPPLDVASLRKEWDAVKASARGLAPESLPSIDILTNRWQDLRDTAAAEHRTVFELSALIAFDTVKNFPKGVAWLGRTAEIAGRRTGQLLAYVLLDGYTETLAEIRTQGIVNWWAPKFRPYLLAAARQFSPSKRSWTQRILKQ